MDEIQKIIKISEAILTDVFMEKDFQEELKQKAKSLNELLEKTLDSKAAAFN